MAQRETKDKFSELYSLNVNGKVEQKNGLKYLSWAYAWAEFKKAYPDATYSIKRDPSNNMPFFSSEFGIMVFTEVTAGGLTYEMWLPVLDGANKAMKSQPWTYVVYNRYTKQNEEKRVDPASMFDINKAIMRCLVKNLAMFGLGLYIYSGEDMPEDNVEAVSEEIEKCSDIQTLTSVFNKHQICINKNASLLKQCKDKKQELLNSKNA